MNSKERVYANMNKQVSIIKNRSVSDFDRVIHSHFLFLSESYQKNKLFYKTLFKSHRFLLSTLLVNEFYTAKTPLLSEVKKDFISMNMLSENTISTFLTYLVVTRRIKLSPLQEDRRKLVFSIMEKGVNEILLLIRTMSIPLDQLCPALNLTQIVRQPDFLPDFFKNYTKIVTHRLFHFEEVAHIDLFILKDAGHMILLSLYCNSQQQAEGGVVSLPISQLANHCGVSRSHIRRIIDEAAAVGLLMFAEKEKKIILFPSFFLMVREYMAYYFAHVLVGFGVSLADPLGESK